MELRIYIRTLTTLTSPNERWLEKQLEGCQKVFFDSMQIRVVQTGKSHAAIRGGVVQVGNCARAELTQNQIDLFGQRKGLKDSDVLVLIAGALEPSGWQGCAIHPDRGQPGVVVAAGLARDRQWILAHELGHVLGLEHVEDKPDRLMYPSINWDRGITPALDASEKAIIRASDLLVT